LDTLGNPKSHRGPTIRQLRGNYISMLRFLVLEQEPGIDLRHMMGWGLAGGLVVALGLVSHGKELPWGRIMGDGDGMGAVV